MQKYTIISYECSPQIELLSCRLGGCIAFAIGPTC